MRRSKARAARRLSNFDLRASTFALRRAFSVVELIVVVLVIAVILGVGLPAFNNMARQSRLSQTQQLTNGILTRTHIISLSDKNLTAVRFCPEEWVQSDKPGSTALNAGAGRQIVTTFSYRFTSAANANAPTSVIFAERFERIEGGPQDVLPPDTWVAPIEAFAMNNVRDAINDRDDLQSSGSNSPRTHQGLLGDIVLDGTIGQFERHAGGQGEQVLEADDFLIVFDPEVGVLPAHQGLRRTERLLKAYDPEAQQDWDGPRTTADFQHPRNEAFVRYNYGGVAVYQREPFLTLGKTADPGSRRDLLRQMSKSYYVSRNGGQLVAGE